MLSPEYYSNITKYTVEVPNDITNLTILAIPQKETARVEIIGNENLKEGDNKEEIIVTAENGITTKKFEILAHRRNAEEETEYKEEQEIQIQRLSALLNEENNITENDMENLGEQDDDKEQTNAEKNSNKIWIGIGVIVVVAIAGIVIYVVKKR